MSIELIGVLVAVLGVALAGMIHTSGRDLRQDMARMDERIGGVVEV